VRAAIHPAIGVGRVGNARDSFYFGPEVPGTIPRSRGGFKDAGGAILPQAARFRVYGLDAAGNVVRELTAPEAEITWRVNVANAKAAWYEFGVAFDLPIAEPIPRRNARLRGGRERLAIAARERSVSGPGAGPVDLDGGAFFDRPVRLGELTTDGAGRLVLIPGRGRAYSHGSAPLVNFSDNDGWADDAADGAVQATVRIGERTIEADPAWVLTTPPNYGPGMVAGLVTLYDDARSTLHDAGMVELGPVSFRDEILPIFARLVDMQWTNLGYLRRNGFGSDEDWLAPKLLRRLADPSARNARFRRGVFKRFRNPAFEHAQPDAIPAMYGDGTALPRTNKWQWLAVTPLQYARLRSWARGEFVDDRDAPPAPSELSELPAAQRPQALDQAALESMLGGAFHPGIEAPWAMRIRSLWESPYRLRIRDTKVDMRDWGPKLTPEVALAPGGPLDGVAPGDLTRWLGVPWHSDAASCRAGYEPRISPVLPTFWPARIPNDVLTEADYRIVMDRRRPISERRAAFRRRLDWERHIARPDRPKTLRLMVENWPKLGLVSERRGPGDDEFPASFKVESELGFAHEPKHTYGPEVWVS
jgi:hypothetical protein